MGCSFERQRMYFSYLLKLFLDEKNYKPNKIWVDKGSDFYNRSVKSWLQDNNTEKRLTYNEGKYVFAERIIKTLNTKIYKYMTSLSKNAYIDKLVI